MDPINAVDIAFVVDTTGSMGLFIEAAKRQMISMIEQLAKSADVAMRVGFVQYRDHPPQDQLVFQASAFTDDLAQAQGTICQLTAQGGGDGPEAVLDGVLAACTELHWREHARRLAVLVGDAPPHGVGCPGDGFRNGCPCGQTIESVTAAAEINRVTLYALGLTGAVTESFNRLARLTGGEYFSAGHGDAAIQTLSKLLANEFGHLETDRAVLDAWTTQSSFSIDQTALKLNKTSGEVAESVTRLMARRLLMPRDPLVPVEVASVA